MRDKQNTSKKDNSIQDNNIILEKFKDMEEWQGIIT
jgi:hypothetical protein